MLLSTNLVGSPVGSATVTKSRSMCEPASIAGSEAPGSANHFVCQVPGSANGVGGNSNTMLTESSTGSAGYGAIGAGLLWPPEDDKSVDQDDGWQVVAGKSCTKVASQHSQQQQLSHSALVTGSNAKVQVCGRCGMRGHVAAKCRQPHCSKCNKWWHTEEECSKSCITCGALDHRVCGSSLCKSYKCRECGLYGHVYAECPNIRCNMCGEVGHKALECPTIVCNICKQKGHKAVHCSHPRSGNSLPAASKPTATDVAELQRLQLATGGPSQQSSCSSSSSVTSPVAAATSVAGAGTVSGGIAKGAATTSSDHTHQQEVPIIQHMQRGSNLAEQQLLQQQHSRLLAQLLKVVPDGAIACLEDGRKLQALYMIEPQYITALLQPAGDTTADVQRLQLEAALASAQRQLQQKEHHSGSGDVPTAHSIQSQPSATGAVLQRKPAHSNSPAAAISAAGYAVNPAAEDLTDATQGIKPGDLAPQHAKQLVAEFGDMLPSRWQQLPSWRQLEARLSFPDGNYVQRRLQFREKRRQLQLMTLQLRTAGSGKQAVSCMVNKLTGVAAITGRPATHTRVVPETPAISLQQQSSAAVSKPAGTAPCSYAAALAGRSAAAAAAAANTNTSINSSQHMPYGSSPVEAAGIGVAVCSRCGMMGHHSNSCVQPRCSRCHLWWHTEAQCSLACQFCGSLDHAGDAEQPASCQSFKCKACRMFGHTQSICPHVQLHQQQLQQQSSTVGSVSSLQPPASPLSSKGVGTGGSSSNGSEASFFMPDSPGLGQQGVKPKDLLPEHAKALQDEFPNALPPGWQQMGSWRMVEERLRVVAVEGAVFSKRRQMWRDRRKHYQALTAQALAAAARSAAAAAASIAAAEESAAARCPAVHNEKQSMTRQQPAEVVHTASSIMQNNDPDAMQQQQPNTQQEVAQQEELNAQPHEPQLSVHTTQQSHVQQLSDHESSTPATCEPKQQTRPHDLKGNQQYLMDPVLVPEWQQQGSLFGLVDAVPHSMPVDSAGTGSAFSCDTNFSSSPPPASDTPSVMLSPLTDGLGYSGGSTPATASANNSNAVTPAASASGFAGVQAGAALTAGMSSPMPSAPSNTPVPTPRSAAAAAGMPPSTAYAISSAVPVDAGRFSPMHLPHTAAPGVMRSPLGYPAVQVPPSSPIDVHMASAAMAAGRGPGPQTYQHMVHVAQRQSQLQQQLMLQQGRYSRPIEQPQGHQQMLMQMQQQHRMQRQCRADQAFLVQQQMRLQQHQQHLQKLQGKPVMAAGLGDDNGETGELDDTLGVLGVLGLQ